MVHDDGSNTSYSGGGSSTTAGSGVTGDSGSDTSYGGGGSDTDAGSGVTGDGGSDTSFGGGSSDTDSSAGGGFGGGGGGDDDDSDFGGGYGGGDDDDDSTGVVGGGGERRGDDDTTYSGGGSDTDTGSGVTDDDGSDTTFSGGQSEQNRTRAPEGETGAEDPQSSTDNTPDRGTSIATTPSGEVVRTGEDTISDPTVREGETSERGVGVTRNQEGTEIVTPEREERPQSTAFGETIGDRQSERQEQTMIREQELQQGRTSSRDPVNAADWAIDIAFQDSEELVRQSDVVAPALGLDTPAAREDRVDIGGPSLSLERGPTDPINTEITNQLTAGSGPLSASQRAELQEDIEAREDFFGVGDEAEEFVTDITGSETVGNFAGGLGRVPGDLAALPAQATLAVDTGTTVASNLPETVEEEGAAEVAATGAAVGGAALSGTVEQARENPAETAGSLTGEILAGTAATRGLSRASDVGRTARVRATADDRVELQEITDERGVEGDLPLFETAPNAPTREAVEEVEQRAADNPDTVTDAVGTDRTLFHSTEADLGEEFDATRGSSELPGLFTAPDASPLRLSGATSASLRDLRPRLPRASDFTGSDDRFAAFEGDRIRGMPDDATESGRVRDGEGGYEPDPETSGSRFLDEEAEEGTAFVRPQGGRTTELEAIFPPGSTFEEAGTLGVDLPSGRTIPLEVYRRADADSVDDISRAADEAGEVPESAVRTAGEISDDLNRRRSGDVDGQPLAPPVLPNSPSASGPRSGRRGSSTPPASTAPPTTPQSTGASSTQATLTPSSIFGRGSSAPSSQGSSSGGGSSAGAGSYSSGGSGRSSSGGGSSSSSFGGGSSSGGGSSGSSGTTTSSTFNFLTPSDSGGNNRRDDRDRDRRSGENVLFGSLADEDRYVANVQGVSDVLF